MTCLLKIWRPKRRATNLAEARLAHVETHTIEAPSYDAAEVKAAELAGLPGQHDGWTLTRY